MIGYGDSQPKIGYMSLKTANPVMGMDETECRLKGRRTPNLT
jgi:hypothetical protein